MYKRNCDVFDSYTPDLTYSSTPNIATSLTTKSSKFFKTRIALAENDSNTMKILSNEIDAVP